MTIHNLKFQGVWDIKTIQGLSDSMSLSVADKLEFKKNGNMLKGGLVCSDYITTVMNLCPGDSDSLLWRGAWTDCCRRGISI